MDNLIKIAINKGIKTPVVTKASKELEEGTYDVDTLVRVCGTVTKGVDFEADSTVSLSTLETLALALHYSGVTRDKAMEILPKILKDGMTNGTKCKGILKDEFNFIAPMIKDIKEKVIKEMPKTQKNGIVTTKLTFTEV